MRPIQRGTLLVTAITMLCNTTGCAAWRVETGSTPTVLATKPSKLLVRTADSTLVLSGPTLSGDTLSGLVGPDHDRRRQSVAREDVRSLSTRQSSLSRTLLLGTGLVLVLAVAAAYAMQDMTIGVGF